MDLGKKENLKTFKLNISFNFTLEVNHLKVKGRGVNFYKETVMKRQWDSATQRFGFINKVDMANEGELRI